VLIQRYLKSFNFRGFTQSFACRANICCQELAAKAEVPCGLSLLIQTRLILETVLM
jgi:hypothetical protein